MYKFKFNNMTRPDLSGSGPCLALRPPLAGNRAPVEVTKWLLDPVPRCRQPVARLGGHPPWEAVMGLPVGQHGLVSRRT